MTTTPGVVAWRTVIAKASTIRTSGCRTLHTKSSTSGIFFVVRCSHRNALQQHLRAHGIQTQVHYPVPPHRQPAYAAMQNVRLPLTEQLHNEVLSLPMGPTLSDDAADQIIAACQSFECPT